MATTEQQSPQSPPAWKQEVLRRKIENERTKDVERRWEKVIETGGADAPEWMREVAMKKKAQRDKLTAQGIPPWMQEMQRRNDNLTKKMKEAQSVDETNSSEKAPSVAPSAQADVQ